jgi:hypothetical protein
MKLGMIVVLVVGCTGAAFAGARTVLVHRESVQQELSRTNTLGKKARINWPRMLIGWACIGLGLGVLLVAFPGWSLSTRYFSQLATFLGIGLAVTARRKT